MGALIIDAYYTKRDGKDKVGGLWMGVSDGKP